MKLTERQRDALANLTMFGVQMRGVMMATGVTNLLALGADGEGHAFLFSLSELLDDISQLKLAVLTHDEGDDVPEGTQPPP